MRLIRTLICIWMFSCLFMASGPYPSPGRCQNRTSHRERTTYTFTYLGFPVAQGSIIISNSTDEDNSSVTMIETRASSSSPTSFLFKIDNRYTTTLDPETGFPLTYEKSIIQSNFKEQTFLRFDQDQGTIYRNAVPCAFHPHPVHNVFSALHHIINHSFGAKEVLAFPVYAAGHIWNVKIEAIGVEKITLPVGSFPAVLLEVEFCPSSSKDTLNIDTDVLTNRLIRGGKKTRLWISRGKQKSLLKGEYELYPTSLHMTLTEKGQ